MPAATQVGIRISYVDIAQILERSRRLIACHFAELREKGICILQPGKNQQSLTEVEICDEFWPYTKEGSSVPQSDFAQYCTGIKFLLSKRSCIQCEFTGADENFAAELFGRKIALSQVERAIALACCRKYAGFLNGTDGEMIHRFSYFRDSIEEILDPEAHPIQAQLLDQRILTAEYLEAKWLAKQERGADAEVSQAAQSNSKRRDDAYDSRKLDGVAERMALECNS